MSFRPKSVSSAVANLSLESAIQRGMSPQEFQQRTGISACEARQVGGRIPMDKHIAMLNLTEPYWNLQHLFGQIADMSFCAPLSMLLGIATNAPTLSVALEKFVEFRPLFGDVDTVQLKRHGSDFEIEYRLDGEGRNAISAFGNLFMMARLAGQYTPDARQTTVIELTGKAFAPPSQLRDFDGRILFGQERNRMRFTTACPDRPYEKHNDISYQIMCGQAKSDMVDLQRTYSFAFQIEKRLTELVREQEHAGFDSNLLERLCAQLSLSRWGVQRRLQRENTSFQKILSDVRVAEAKRLLTQSSMAISDISDMLGFSSPPAFSRFFSDQSGISPSRYKSDHRRL